MTCKNCGAEIGEGMKFCENCGTEIVVEEVVLNETSQPSEQTDKNTQSDEEALCKNCGVPVEEGSVFCPQCGVKYEDDAQDTTAVAAFCENCGAPVEAGLVYCENCGVKIGGEEKPKSKALLSVLKKVNIPVIVAIILIVSLVAYAAPVIKTSVVKTFTSSEGYFKYVANKSFGDFSEDFADLYEVAMSNTTENKGAKGTAEITVGDGLSELLDDLGADVEPDYIDWFESAKLDIKASRRDDRVGANIGVKLNDEDIASMDMVLDTKEMKSYMSFPGINSDYIFVDLDSYYYGAESMQQLEEILNVLPDEKVTKNLLCKYMEYLVNSVDEVEETKETIQAGDISQKVTALTAIIDGDTLITAGKNALKALKKDKDVKKIVEDICKIDEVGGSYKDFLESVDAAIENLEDTDGKELFEEECEFTLYVDNKSELAGIMFEYEDVNIEAYTAEKGSKIGTYLKIRASGTAVSFEGSGKMSGDKISGDFDLKVAGIDILTISLDKLDKEKLIDGVINGKATITPNEDIEDLPADYTDVISKLAIVIDGKSKSVDDVKETIVLEYDGKECAKIAYDVKETGADKVSVPKKFVDANDYDEAEKWREKADIDKLIKSLEKAGVPDELTDMIE